MPLDAMHAVAEEPPRPPSPSDSMCSSVRVRGRENSVSDLAADNFEARYEYCAVDYYGYSGPSPRHYIEVPKNTLPEIMRPHFLPSQDAPLVPPGGSLHYDREKFMLTEVSSIASRPSEVFSIWIESLPCQQNVAYVEWLHTGFGVLLNSAYTDALFPFSAAEFLQVVHVAKVQLELYGLPPLWSSESERESGDEAEAMSVDGDEATRGLKRPLSLESMGSDEVSKRWRPSENEPDT